MKFFDINFKEIFYSQLVSIAGGLIAGTVLAIHTEKILLIPSMFLLLPGFLEMRANITAPLASRLSSGLFLGVIKKKQKTKIITGNVIASFVLSIIVSLLLGVIAFVVNYFILQVYTPKLIIIVLIAGVLANIIEIPITLFVTFYLFKKGHDPNNIIGPFLTSLGDIVSVISILVALVVII